MTHQITVIGYLAILALGLVIWFATRKAGTSRFTSLNTMFEHLMRYRGTRLGMVIFWWWLGWHFLVSVIQR